MIKDTIWAYAAGLIDGEGYIGLHKNSVSKHSFIGVIKVVSIDPYMAPFLHEHFGGSVSVRRRNHAKWTDETEWMLRGKENLKFFLNGVMPYLQVKKDQAQHLIAFLDEVGDFKGKRKFVNGKSVYDKNFVARRHWYYQEGKRVRHQYQH
jgi:hypothetical protein